MRCNRFQVVLAVAAVIVFALASSANAATLSTSATAPTVDGLDIASLPTTGTSAGSKYWLWDGDAPGQTFTIGSDDALLNAITLRVWSPTVPTKVHDFWIGEVSGNSYIGTIHNETAFQNAAAGNWNGDDYVTFTLDTPIAMDAGKTYGFDMVMASSTTGWQSGIPYLHTSGDLYSGGTRIQAGSKPTVHINPFNIRSGDMVFHLDMTAAAAPVIPEPSTLAIWALGLCCAGLSIWGRRRRR